jgi:hypothetical protein
MASDNEMLIKTTVFVYKLNKDDDKAYEQLDTMSLEELQSFSDMLDDLSSDARFVHMKKRRENM